MIFPPFLKDGDIIGIAAPSEGIAPEDHAAFDLSLSHIRAAGYRIREAAGVRQGGTAPAAARAADVNALLRDDSVDMLWCAAGGDLLLETLPLLDFEAAAAHPKWVQGYSDPTSLLYTLTTVYDIATIYGTNAGGLDMTVLHPSLADSLSLLRGECAAQHSFPLFQRERWDGDGYQLSVPVYWETPRGAVNVQGRLLGGCLDCLRNLVGTPFDGTADFVRRYAADGILWYFDIFAMTAEEAYLTLWQLRQCGWFQNAVGVMFGRVCFPNSHIGMTYCEAAMRALPDLPLILEADVGHIPPRMTLVNGALAHLTAEDGKGRLTMEMR